MGDLVTRKSLSARRSKMRWASGIDSVEDEREMERREEQRRCLTISARREVAGMKDEEKKVVE